MSIRNRLLLLLLAIALTPLVFTSLSQQVSIWHMRNKLSVRTQAALEKNAREALQERLQSDVEILELDRELADVQLRRQVREVEQRLAGISLPAFDRPPEGPGLRGEPEPGRGGRRPGEGRGGMPAMRPRIQANAEFGLDPNLTVSAAIDDPNAGTLKANYQAQSCLVAGDPNDAVTRQAMERLAGMTGIYKDIYSRGPTGILWLHTTLMSGMMSGVQMTYPGGVLPQDLSGYNPLLDAWYLQTALTTRQNRRGGRAGGLASTPEPNGPRSMRGMSLRGFGPGRGMRGPDPANERQAVEARQGIVARDPLTGQDVVIRSMPITDANGQFVGAVAMVRTIPEIFSSLQLPARWGPDVERMLVLVDPNARSAGRKVRILLDESGRSNTSPEPSMNSMRHGPGFMGPFSGFGESRPRFLEVDVNELPLVERVAGDITMSQDGIQQMKYKGRSSLVAYQPLDIPYAAAVLVIPYDRVIAMASEVEQSLVKESVRWLQVMTLVILIAAVAAVSLAAVKARNLTQPINALIEAGKQLGGGDYNARVDIRTNDELEHLGRVFNEAGPKLRDHARMKQSLELASAIQHSLLPGGIPDLEHFEVAGRCVYCDETGGDYFDFIRLPTDGGARRLGLALGDVSGHGIGAALLMAGTRGLLHAEAPHAQDDLAGLMTRLNRELAHDTAEETFVTLFYGILDDAQRSLVWASAGHEPATWYRASTARIEELPNTGMLLGVEPEAHYRQAGPVVLAPGDILVIGTDGIWEAHDDAGRLFGKDRFHRIVQDAAALSANEICDRIIDAVAMFVHPAPHSDDITLIVVKTK